MKIWQYRRIIRIRNRLDCRCMFVCMQVQYSSEDRLSNPARPTLEGGCRRIEGPTHT